MVSDSRDLGFSETAPSGSSGRNNPPSEPKPVPPADRPVYSVPADSPATEPDKMNFTVFFVSAIFVLAIGAAYLYQSGFIGRKSVANHPAAKAEPGAIAPAPTESNDRSALKIEMLRTISLLEEMEGLYADNPKKSDKIKELTWEAKDILASLEK